MWASICTAERERAVPSDDGASAHLFKTATHSCGAWGHFLFSLPSEKAVKHVYVVLVIIDLQKDFSVGNHFDVVLFLFKST